MKHEPQKSASGRTAIIVAGMHRSGTSATTRIVNLLGAELARDLIPADIGNERGHWESRAVQHLHNALLAELGSDLYSPVSIAAEWFDSAAAQPWIARIRELVADEYASSRFVVKDPRIVLFLPLWSEALRQSDILPRFVLPFRHPGAVANSLDVRERQLASGNALPHAQGEAVWLRYVLAAERFTRGQARTFVAFDRVLSDWRAEFARMGTQLGIEWPNWQWAESEIDDFLDADRRGHETGKAETGIAGIGGDVHASLTRLVQDPHAAVPALDTAVQAVAAAESLLGPHIVARERVFDDLRRRADAQAQRHDSERASMHSQFAVEIGLRDTRIAEATAHAQRLEETVATLERERATASDYARSLEQDRDRAIDNAAQQEREGSEQHARFASEIELRDARIAEAADHARRLQDSVAALEHERDRAIASAAQRERERADLHAQAATEIAARDTRIEEAAAHARRMDETVALLEREHGNASDYARALALDRDRAVEYAASLAESRDEAIAYAQALEQERSEATRQRRTEIVAHNGLPVFFTIASRNYLAYAKTLMQSVAAHYPDAPR